MNSKVFVASIAFLMLTISLPANAQSLPANTQSKTPVTDKFGATGTTPDRDRWREECRIVYGIRIKPDGTLMIDTTPFTDEFGATGKTPNANQWQKKVSGGF